LSLRNNDLTVRGTAADAYALMCGGTTVSRVRALDNVIRCPEGSPPVHVHEGAADVLIARNTVLNTAEPEDAPAVSIRARAYDVLVLGNHLVNAGSTACIYVDPSCTGPGVIAGNRIEGGNFTAAIAVAGPAAGWCVDKNVSSRPAVFYG
jgi:hypothetical protein